tara:strand:- start:623 stop:1894 length:1272 start_codon:yes stop_codon:yes gene_type:complete
VTNQKIRKTVLPNGLRVISEQIPQVRSVAIGCWVSAGSRNEVDEESGISHFVEHMVFKGTENRTADQIAYSIDAIGGHLDAFTTKETVAFTAKVLDEHVPRAVDVLSDLVLNPTFYEEDIEREKGVVLEELKMDEDNPDHLLHETFVSNFWPGHPLGRAIIGNEQAIRCFTSEQVRIFFQGTYSPDNLMFVAAGNIAHEELVSLVGDRFGELTSRATQKITTAPKNQSSVTLRDKPSLEQVHLCLGVPAYEIAHSKRHAGYVLNTILGGGISSRLFLRIREHEGLAYSVFSDLGVFDDSGMLYVYAGTSTDNARRVVNNIIEEMKRLKEVLVDEEELRRAKDYMKGSLTLSLESTSSRMSNLARQERYFQRFTSIDELHDKIEQVDSSSICEVADEWFGEEKVSLAMLGDLKGLSISQVDLKF